MRTISTQFKQANWEWNPNNNSTHKKRKATHRNTPKQGAATAMNAKWQKRQIDIRGNPRWYRDLYHSWKDTPSIGEICILTVLHRIYAIPEILQWHSSCMEDGPQRKETSEKRAMGRHAHTKFQRITQIKSQDNRVMPALKQTQKWELTDDTENNPLESATKTLFWKNLLTF